MKVSSTLFSPTTQCRYGDKSPKGLLARIFAAVWMLVGITIISIYTATLTSALMSVFYQEAKISFYQKKVRHHYYPIPGPGIVYPAVDLDMQQNLRRGECVLLLISIDNDFLIIFCAPTFNFVACLDPPLTVLSRNIFVGIILYHTRFTLHSRGIFG